MMSRKFFIFLFFILFSSLSLADTVAQQDNQQKQLIDSLNHIENNLTQSYSENVYLGTNGLILKQLKAQVGFQKKELTLLLKKINNVQSSKSISTLKWLNQSMTEQNKKTYVNVGTKIRPIYICRAQFIGARMTYQQASYPGELINTGCRISYAGYAFSVPTFDVLTGKKEALRWMPILSVKKSIQSESAKKPTANASHQNINAFNEFNPINQSPQSSNKLNFNNFNFNINIDGYMPISGGYQGENPVLICRAQKNNHFTIGKLVFFDNTFGCDIGVDSKEITVMHDYDLLFAK